MNVATLYAHYETLSSAKEDISKHENAYADAIKATRCGEKEKQLAAQIISKFFTSFPTMQDEAINAVFDLCEDDDKNIRIAAMKALPLFCKESNYIARVADIMSQMLQLEDASEQLIATNVLLQILKLEPSTVIKCIFKNINDPSAESNLGEKCINFILTKSKLLDKSILTADIQDLITKNVFETIQDCTAEEFLLLMAYLIQSSYVKTFTGQKALFEIVFNQIEINKPFVVGAEANNYVNRLVCCVKFIVPFFSNKVDLMDLYVHYCTQVLPKWDEIATIDNGLQYQTAVAQQFAAILLHCNTTERPIDEVTSVYQILLQYMPLPPTDTEQSEIPFLNFTLVEALLFAFHSLAKSHPEFLTEDPTLLKDFRSRLLYFSQSVQGCQKALQMSDTEKVFSAEEKRKREVCPVMLKNIHSLIVDLFHQPPSYKSKVDLSFLKKGESVPMVAAAAVEKNTAVASVEAVSLPTKRHTPITYESSNGNGTKQMRRSGNEKKIYTPPSGKFSHNFYSGNQGNGGRFRGHRGNRGKGRGGYNRN